MRARKENENFMMMFEQGGGGGGGGGNVAISSFLGEGNIVKGRYSAIDANGKEIRLGSRLGRSFVN